MIFNADTKLLLLGAAILIAASGVCLTAQQHVLARRLFLAGGVLAAADGVISANGGSTPADRIAAICALVAAASLCAILIFKMRRRATYLVAAGIAGWLFASTFKSTINWLLGHWWIFPIVLLVPSAAALVAKTWLSGVDDVSRGTRTTNSGTHSLFRLLAGLGRAHGGARRRKRHIGDIGATRRSRHGPGPNMI